MAETELQLPHKLTLNERKSLFVGEGLDPPETSGTVKGGSRPSPTYSPSSGHSL